MLFRSDYAMAFAKRLPQDIPEKAISDAWRLAFWRNPSEAEVLASNRFLSRQQEVHASTGGEDALCQAYVDLCQTILSMNEFVYVE